MYVYSSTGDGQKSSIIIWISRTQKCVSQSTSEAESLAMGDGVKEALFVNGMLQFLRPSAIVIALIARRASKFDLKIEIRSSGQFTQIRSVFFSA